MATLTLTPLEAAAALRVSRRTVYRLIADGELPARRFGGQYRILGAEFEKLLTTDTPSRDGVPS